MGSSGRRDDRDRDGAGRARNARPRDALGRPLPPGSAGVAAPELRRCREHCDGRSEIVHWTTADHACTRRCRRHACKPLAAWTIRYIHYLISGA